MCPATPRSVNGVLSKVNRPDSNREHHHHNTSAIVTAQAALDEKRWLDDQWRGRL
jgi:hypothetical protein